MNKNTSLLKNFYKLFQLPSRTESYGKLKPVEYHGFKYYPRHEGFKDPPYNPSKLFLIRRIAKVKGTNYIERDCLQRLNIDGHIKQDGHINIVKNIPEINAILWQVKHLVEIKPIYWKGELPKNAEEVGSYLRDTGELVLSPKLYVDSKVLETTEKHLKNEKTITKKYIKEYLLKKWVNGFSGEV